MANLKPLRMVLSVDDENREHMAAQPRAFESGAEGYFLGGKVVMDGHTFQVSCNVVRVGSKDEPEAAERAQSVKAMKAAKAERAKGKAGTAVATTDAD